MILFVFLQIYVESQGFGENKRQDIQMLLWVISKFVLESKEKSYSDLLRGMQDESYLNGDNSKTL